VHSDSALPLSRRSPEPGRGLESTKTLILRIRSGDENAREDLFARFLPALRRWAHGRLPRRARGLADTDDLVQNSVLRALARVDEFDPRRPGAFLAYLHQILLNNIREEIRRAGRRPEAVELPGDFPEELPEERASVLDRTVGKEMVDLYEAALARLPEMQQQAVCLRIEFGFSHQEIADALKRPSAAAARMLVVRGISRLAELMQRAVAES
jgi:RNA polymerase sigma-70 factor (ECF subfamily)